MTAHGDRHLDADRPGEMMRPRAGGVQHLARLDAAAARLDGADAIAGHVDAGDARLFHDRDAHLARGGGEARGGLRGIGVARVGLVARRGEIVDGEARLDRLRLRRRDQPAVDALRLLQAHRRLHLLAQAVVHAEEVARADEAGGAPVRQLLEALEEAERLQDEAARLGRRVVLAHARRAPARRSRREELLLDEHDALHPALREVIGGAGARRAAPDDHDLRRRRHLTPPGQSLRGPYVS